MKINASKFEAVVFGWKWVDCQLWVGNEPLPQMEEFDYFWVLFISVHRMEQETDKQIGVGSICNIADAVLLW